MAEVDLVAVISTTCTSSISSRAEEGFPLVSEPRSSRQSSVAAVVRMRQHIINVFISPALCPECSAGPGTGAGYGIVRRQ
jgi:hypothetical protein